MASEDSQSSGGRKTITSATTTTPLRPPEQGLKCPRCDSPNTKFCYYNNYSLTQPRHFCKTCRRYWTKGGALRNVPVGGGCRKAKKTKSSSGTSSSSRLPSDFSDTEPGAGLRFFNNQLAPASADFQLGVLPFSRIQSPSFNNNNNNHLISFGEFSSAGAISASSNYHPIFPSSTVGGGVYGETSIASSIESLSSINQDLHWKLQQQRLAMLFGGEAAAQKDHQTSTVPNSLPTPLLADSQPEPVPPFQVPAGNSKSWFLDSPYINTTTNNNNSNNNNNDNSTVSNWNGMTTWNDMHHQFTTMP